MTKRAAEGTGWREAVRYLGGTPFEETRFLHRFVREINEVQIRNRRKAGAPVLQRAFHAKLHAGIGQAELHVLETLPEELRAGPFTPGARLPATLRFSNAAGTIRADSEPDLRGLALRLEGERTQDFLFTNAPVAHVQDAHQFLQVALAEAASRTRTGTLLRMALRIGPAEAWRVANALRPSMRRPVASLLTETYWAQVPYAFGEIAVRLRLQPDQLPPAQRGDGEHYLRQELVARLRTGPATFRLQVQRYRDEISTPLEQARETWDTPFETIGRLIIPQQDLDTAMAREQESCIEAMQFTPWNTHPDVIPIGSLNRARRLAYEASQQLRTGLRTQAPHSDASQVADRILGLAFAALNRLVPWYRLPRCLGLLNLKAIGDRGRRTILHENPAVPFTPT
ncbi:MAG TPA: catalase, partial [Chromatiales bacterium]|nr:catalase [Chromatiales bacterium]